MRREDLLQYPFIIQTPGCDNDILHLLESCKKKPKTSYSFRDDTLIMAFVKSGLGVTISQELVMKAFANDVESRPLEPGRSRIIGLAFARTMNSVVTKILVEYFQQNMEVACGGRRPDAPKGQRVGRLVSGARNSKAREIS